MLLKTTAAAPDTTPTIPRINPVTANAFFIQTASFFPLSYHNRKKYAIMPLVSLGEFSMLFLFKQMEEG